MKSEPISPILGLKSGSEDDIEIVEIFEKDFITDKDNPETAMNRTYEVMTETEIVDDIEVFDISDNQDKDQEVQTIEVVQDKMTPKLTKDQMAINKLREIRKELDARGLKSISIVTPANTLDEIVQDEENDTIEEDTVNNGHVENQGCGDNFNVKSALLKEFNEKLAAHGLEFNSNNVDKLIQNKKQSSVKSIVLKVDSMPNCKICGLVYSNQRMGKPEIRRHLFTEHCLQNDILKKVNTFFNTIFFSKGAFNDYVDTILLFFDHHLPLRGHFLST